MPDLTFAIESAKAVKYAASPELALAVAIHDRAGREIQSVSLTAQVWIEAKERVYSKEQKERLVDLFGDESRWDRTLRRMMWARTSIVVPAFESLTAVDMPLPCPWDFEASVTKYLFSMADGAIPLTLQFSGSVFFTHEGALQIAPIPWTSEARFALPVSIYRETLDHYYPNRVPLALRRDVFERLERYKTMTESASFEAALEKLLPEEKRA